ncbi:glutathione S-transferase family protein [Thalassotalea sediminis]|uniref:glutathione S-transferase family protein n=1 Tax=Thalassotalea sediminis TaxID=1759089 RepID=UPI0025725FC9|nr:glutathione S-transferase family protein [Thalassotalea sediminis]
MSTITIIGPQFSTFVRTIELICRFKNIPYQVSMEHEGKVIEFRDTLHQQLHPFTKVPVLIDGDLILPESYAIAAYLNDISGPDIFSASVKDKAIVNAWAHIIAEYVYQDLIRHYLLEIHMPKGENGNIRIDVVNEHKPIAQKTLQKLEAQIGDQGFFIGDTFTLCDALLLPILAYVFVIPEPFSIHQNTPKLARYFDKLSAYDFVSGVLTLPQE